VREINFCIIKSLEIEAFLCSDELLKLSSLSLPYKLVGSKIDIFSGFFVESQTKEINRPTSISNYFSLLLGIPLPAFWNSFALFLIGHNVPP